MNIKQLLVAAVLGTAIAGVGGYYIGRATKGLEVGKKKEYEDFNREMKLRELVEKETKELKNVIDDLIADNEKLRQILKEKAVTTFYGDQDIIHGIRTLRRRYADLPGYDTTNFMYSYIANR